MTHVLNRVFIHIWLILFVVFLLLPLTASAQGFVSLVGIPGLDGSAPNMQKYIESLMRIAIIAASLIAVIKLILAGAKYVLSGIVTDKEQAKKDIRSALIGLLIVLAAVTILRTINPKLTNLPALESAPPIPFTPYTPDVGDRSLGNNRLTCDPGFTVAVTNGQSLECIPEEEIEPLVLITPENSNFSVLPVNGRSFDDARARSIQLSNIPFDKILGYLIFDDREAGSREFLAQFRNKNAMQAFLNEQCQTGNTPENNNEGNYLIIINNLNTTGYYCIKGG